jgi:hypothetical protein
VPSGRPTAKWTRVRRLNMPEPKRKNVALYGARGCHFGCQTAFVSRYHAEKPLIFLVSRPGLEPGTL